MRLPNRDYVLEAGLLCPSTSIEQRNWQAHVVKHPLGVGAIARRAGRDGWNTEGWDALEPPVVTERTRERLVGAIANAAQPGQRCGVPELRGRRGGSDPMRLACHDCAPPLLQACDELVNPADGVGTRYADVTEQLLSAVAQGAGVEVSRQDFVRVVHSLWRSPDRLRGLIVLTVGLDPRAARVPVVRLSRDDGVRAEFYLQEPNRLTWRTTYRMAEETRTAAARIGFLMSVPRPAPGLGRLSDLCVVTRRWWESHAH